jgi:hypothetical protein
MQWPLVRNTCRSNDCTQLFSTKATKFLQRFSTVTLYTHYNLPLPNKWHVLYNPIKANLPHDYITIHTYKYTYVTFKTWLDHCISHLWLTYNVIIGDNWISMTEVYKMLVAYQLFQWRHQNSGTLSVPFTEKSMLIYRQDISPRHGVRALRNFCSSLETTLRFALTGGLLLGQD